MVRVGEDGGRGTRRGCVGMVTSIGGESTMGVEGEVELGGWRGETSVGV